MRTPQRFRKKPIEIDAMRLPVWGDPNVPRDHHPVPAWAAGSFSSITYVEECIDISEWCGGFSHMMVSGDEKAFADALVVTGPHMVIPTLEGDMIARPGDYIIRGVQGEFYPCKPDIFAATYVVVE